MSVDGPRVEVQLATERSGYPIFHTGRTVIAIVSLPIEAGRFVDGVSLLDSLDRVQSVEYPNCIGRIRYASGRMQIVTNAMGHQYLEIEGYIQGGEGCYSDGIRLRRRIPIGRESECTFTESASRVASPPSD